MAKPVLSFMLQAYSGIDGSVHEMDLKVGQHATKKLSPSVVKNAMPVCVLFLNPPLHLCVLCLDPPPPPGHTGFTCSSFGVTRGGAYTHCSRDQDHTH
jgi:hypothetical protein